MKLKKVLSLVLGGALALSMLAGCSSSSTEEPTVTVENVNTGVVAYVQANLDKDTMGIDQAAQTLAGSESDHLKAALNTMKGGNTVNYYDVTAITEKTLELDETGESKTDVVVIRKGGTDATDLGKAIVKALENRYETATEDSDSSAYAIASMTVFEYEVENGDYDYFINGTQIADTEYWIVVYTNVAKASTNKAGTIIDE